MQENSSSSGQNVTSQAQRRTSNICLQCREPFIDSNSADFCPKCNDRIRYSSSYRDPISQPTTGSRPTNLYLSDLNRGYSPALTPTPKIRTQYKVICPRCKNPNVQYNLTSNSEYWCSVCQTLIPIHYY